MCRETTRSTLYIPGMSFGSILCLFFAVMGLVIYFAASPFGLSFVGLGCLGLAAIVYWHFARPEFEHAPPGTLPGVPEKPVICEGRTSFSWIPYELAREGTMARLQVAKDPARIALPIFSILLFGTIGGLFVYVFWFTERGQGVPLTLRVMIVGASVVASVAFPAIFLYFRAWELKKLDRLILDHHERRLDFGELELSFDQIIALQLCAFARRADPQPELTYDWFRPFDPGFQLNLIWTEVSSRDPQPDSYCRQTLFLVGTDPRLGPFAADLAEALAVPLLNHATREHWTRERRAAKHRPLVKGSSI